MITISLCMIVKNEEAVLERCLNSAKDIVDEIIIVDTGSSDNTKKIAKGFTDKIFDFEWVDDFSKARNYSFLQATQEYIMWLDADDVILDADKEKLLKLKKTLSPEYDIVTTRYNVGFDQNGKPTFYSTRERLFKRKNNPVWMDPIHEYIPIGGNVLQLADIYITHMAQHKTQTDRNLKIYQKTLKNEGRLSPRGQYYYARELKDHGQYLDATTYFNMFLTEGRGWREDNIASCYNLAVCYKILGMQDKVFEALLKSFEYDAPRAENCCLLGYYYKDKADYNTAVGWFLTALSLPKREHLGFCLSDYLAFIPAIELAVCYDKLQMYDKANYYNELAGKQKPQSKEYLQNKNYFESMLPASAKT